jgi:hypothetical protein
MFVITVVGLGPQQVDTGGIRAPACGTTMPIAGTDEPLGADSRHAPVTIPSGLLIAFHGVPLPAILLFCYPGTGMD